MNLEYNAITYIYIYNAKLAYHQFFQCFVMFCNIFHCSLLLTSVNFISKYIIFSVLLYMFCFIKIIFCSSLFVTGVQKSNCLLYSVYVSKMITCINNSKFTYSITFATKAVISSENNDSFVSSFLILIFSVYFSCPITLARTSNVMLNKSREGHLILSLR